MSHYQKKRVQRKHMRRRRAHLRIRRRIQGNAERPRLAVFKSLKYIYAQVIDDSVGHTLAHASSLEPEVRSKLEGATGNRKAARVVGEVIAERAREKGIEKVVFDRGGYIFHGKIKEVAEGARGKGLVF